MVGEYIFYPLPSFLHSQLKQVRTFDCTQLLVLQSGAHDTQRDSHTAACYSLELKHL